jgi:hypothetical protein
VHAGGDEYVVDTVSRDGVHKCVAIWKYMKEPCNGVPNCWFGQRLMPVDAEPHLDGFAPYIFGVLDAIGIRNGAVHSEVKFNGATEEGIRRGPVLIECNCRLHGIEVRPCQLICALMTCPRTSSTHAFAFDVCPRRLCSTALSRGLSLPSGFVVPGGRQGDGLLTGVCASRCVL